MLFVQALAAMWSIGCIVAVFAFLHWLWNEESVFASCVAGLISLPITALFAVLPWAMLADEKSPDLAVLKKGQWACSAYRQQVVMVPVTVGKVTTMQARIHNICIQYNRL